ncbi:sensor histidine kinase [Nonomuraea guangzhouensis]|uniref:histidine kinase n=1 Tax=Nonomuraea guangzhouensis TaxID=1291555 RepID=A0ABW4G1B7_9ACTN|nr:histidine kinase [Nonomuraea guangzhouensis]
MNRLRDMVAKAFRDGDLLLWAAITVPMFLANESPEVGQPPGLPLSWVRIAAVPLLALAVAVGRRWPVVAAGVPAALALAVTPELYTDSFMITQLLLAFLLGRRTASMRPGLLFFAGVCLAGLAAVYLVPGVTLSNWLSLVTNAVAIILLPWLAGRYARQHDELVRTGWELAERLERERDLIGERMRLVERSRIAGDMHDSLGHDLSLVALSAAALQVHPGLDEPARKAAAELRASAALATERLREIIGVLREDGETAPVLPSGDTVAALVNRAAAAGMAVRLDDGLGSLTPMADRAAYRVVQEALTNAAKHAPGAAVTVRLDADPAAGEAVISVVNTAPPAGPLPETLPGMGVRPGQRLDRGLPEAAVQPEQRAGRGLPQAGSGGYGLVSLDERVRLAGGTLRAGPADGGFAVTARLPLTAGGAVHGAEAASPTTEGAVHTAEAAALTAGGAALAPEGAALTAEAASLTAEGAALAVGGAALTAGDAAAPPDSRRELALARRKIRRSVIDAIWMPVVAAAALLPLTSGYDLYTAHRSVLDAGVYGELRVGQSLASLKSRLPAYQVDDDGRPRGAPADPRGTDECRFYRISADSPSPAHRLCFTSGRLSHKDTVSTVRR